MKQRILDSGLIAGALRIAGRLRRTQRNAALIIRYHAILEPASPAAEYIPAGISHTPGQLRSHLAILRRHFNILPLREMLASLKAGQPLPPRSVVLTFDDGFADNHDTAAPILADHRAPAAFFLTTGLIGTPSLPWFCRTQWAFSNTSERTWQEPTFGKRFSLDSDAARTAARRAANLACASASAQNRERYLLELEETLRAAPPVPAAPLMMDWRHAAALLAAGHVVDSHSVTHPNMALLSAEEAGWEARESRRHLLEGIGAGGEVFCYPNPFGKPNADSLTRAVLEAEGYAAALLVQAGTVTSSSDPFLLNRIHTPGDPARFHLSLERWFAGQGR